MIHTDLIILLWSSRILFLNSFFKQKPFFPLVQHGNKAESRQCENEETSARFEDLLCGVAFWLLEIIV